MQMMNEVEAKSRHFEEQLGVIDKSASSFPGPLLVDVPEMDGVSSDYVHGFK